MTDSEPRCASPSIPTLDSPLPWYCPLCDQGQSPLFWVDGGAVCEQGHRFDLAKEGYLNLLPVQHRHSKAPGDSAEMVRGRQAFLASGAYEPLVDRLWQVIEPLIARHTSELPNPANLTALDCGCGEGYYVSHFQKQAQSVDVSLQWLGLDISKLAVKKAAKQLPKGQTAVASSFYIPLADASLDFVTRVFAPADLSEIQRVIRSKGWFLDVAPGPKHLLELKQYVYAEAREHALPPIWEGWQLAQEIPLRFEMTLTQADLVNHLLLMTPFHWKISADNREKLLSQEQWRITADFCIRLYQKP